MAQQTTPKKKTPTTSNIDCGTCGNKLLEDPEPSYSYWRYFCKTCNQFKVVYASD